MLRKMVLLVRQSQGYVMYPLLNLNLHHLRKLHYLPDKISALIVKDSLCKYIAAMWILMGFTQGNGTAFVGIAHLGE